MGALQQLIRVFLPEDGRFFDHLDAAAVAADEAAARFLELTRAQGRDAQLVLVERIRQAEHDGDKARREMSEALDRTFVTPIDREDLYHLINALEVVSDFIAATALHLTVHAMDELPLGSQELATTLHKATTLMREIVPLLRSPKGFDRVREGCKALGDLEHEADVIFRLRLGDLFANEKDAIRLLKHKEFLEGLEDAVDRCAIVCNVIETVLIKNA